MLSERDVRQRVEDSVKLLREIEKSNEFKLVVDQDNIKVEKIPPPPFTGTYRMTGVVRSSAEKAFTALCDVKSIMKQSDTMVRCDVIQMFDEGKIKIMYQEHKSPITGISPRDFVNMSTYRKEEDGSYAIVNSGSSHPSYPERPGYVRGQLHVSGYFIYPLTETTCKVVYFLRTDLKGWLPAWIVSFADKSFPETFKLTEQTVLQYNNERVE
ncbi:StAR-related lipid transfer protein [Acrasis kona]|uniref:StAR-related lipid transfer protein n=1 Tax=Acrasis kona TaxID=1008807 RepID=A0AAW2YL20_9EUKA